jgi:hypothetical protein
VSPAVANLCRVCRAHPEAIWRTGFCFTCWPGGPVTPPPCLGCGSRDDYYTNGKCRRCHLRGRPSPESCPDCLAWGTTRKGKWLCHACRSWREIYPEQGTCRTCGALAHLRSRDGICRLCFAHARNMIPVLGRYDPAEANRYGQQLFLANLKMRKGSSRADWEAEQRACAAPIVGPSNSRKEIRPLLQPPLPFPGRTVPDGDYAIASRYEQTTMFPAERDYTRVRQKDLPWPKDPRLLHELWALADARSERLGWAKGVRMRCRAGLRVVLGLQDTPGAPIPLTSLEFLNQIHLTAKHVAAVLDEAGLLLDDRADTLGTWLDARLAGLPEQMISEIRVWYEVMAHGRTTPPHRRRPRGPITIRLHFSWALPVLKTWADAGHESLREITRDHVTAALTAARFPARTGQGLRSVLRLLKQEHVIFADPTARMHLGEHPSREPLPVATDAIKALLDTANPARAAVAAIVAFHALHTGQVCNLKLVDVDAGWLHLDGRKIPLAEPVRQRVAAYLDYRNATWPNTANPHLFVNRRTATELREVGIRWIKLLLGPGVSCRSIREDRILAEAMANHGDPRRLHDMFGLSINASLRYTNVVDHPGLDVLEDTGWQRPRPET